MIMRRTKIKKTRFCYNVSATRPVFHKALLTLLLSVVILAPGACRQSSPPPVSPNEPNAVPEPSKEPNIPPEFSGEPNAVPVAPSAQTSLFDGKTLGRWNITDFGGQGDVYVKDGTLFLEMGNDMTGVTWAGSVVRMNYEITLDAKRVSGTDIFCGLTFPYGKDHCSLILGGWGGEICGLSNINYYDASDNETTRLISFENGRWYHVRLRVTPGKIQAWLDGEELVNVEIGDRKIDTRAEMDLSHPLGIATWQTASAIRNINLKKLPDESVGNP